MPRGRWVTTACAAKLTGLSSRIIDRWRLAGLLPGSQRLAARGRPWVVALGEVKAVAISKCYLLVAP